MRQAVVDHGRDAGVAEQDLVHAARGGVAFVGGLHIGDEEFADARDAVEERAGDEAGGVDDGREAQRGGRAGGALGRGLAIQVVVEDGFDGAVGFRADIEGATGGGFERTGNSSA
jgi:hypothetical protein